MRNYFLLTFFLFPVWVQAQNLVPNPSFEEYTTCPTDISETTYLEDWIYISFTPDYFNKCDTINNIVSIPKNDFGYQQAPSNGNAYIGLYAFLSGTSLNSREIIGTRLNDSLIIGKKYYASIKVSLANCLPCAINNIGAFFSTIPLIYSYPINLPNHAQIYSHSIISDTINWTVISGSFVADSAYKYIFLGNFFDNKHTDTLIVNTNPCSGWGFSASSCDSYYYIDDVCVSPDSGECEVSNGINDYISLNSINIYPNPVSAKIYINLNDKCNCSLINLLGIRLNTFYFNKASSIDVSQIPNGIYFLELQYENQIITKKIIIIH